MIIYLKLQGLISSKNIHRRLIQVIARDQNMTCYDNSR